MIPELSNWITIPLLIFGLIGGGIVMAWIKSNRFVRTLRPPTDTRRRREMLRGVERRR